MRWQPLLVVGTARAYRPRLNETLWSVDSWTVGGTVSTQARTFQGRALWPIRPAQTSQRIMSQCVIPAHIAGTSRQRKLLIETL